MMTHRTAFGVLAVWLVGGITPGQASASRGYDLTPWVLDIIKMQAGQSGELDWTSPDAPDPARIEADLASRPTLSGPELLREGDTFVIHYTTSGDDAATEDQVDAAFIAIERSWDVELAGMGYPTPPGDGVNGGDSRYDFYFTKQRGTYGVTYGEDFIDDNTMTSWIALATWMNADEIAVTVAHEFFHAIHYTMDSLEEGWWFEVTATWMEDVVYDDVNDYYNYLPSTLEHPETPLNDNSSIMYGNAIWAHSLTEKYGNQVIQDIWYLSSMENSRMALESNKAVLADLSESGFNGDLQYWREAFIDQARFSEGTSFPDAAMNHVFSNWPVGDVIDLVVPLGAHLIEIPGDGGDVPTTLSLSLPGNTALITSVLLQEVIGGQPVFTEWFPDSAMGGAMVTTIDDFGGRWKAAYVVISNVDTRLDDTYALHVEAPGWGGSGGPGCDSRGGSSPFSGMAYILLLGLSARLVRRR